MTAVNAATAEALAQNAEGEKRRRFPRRRIAAVACVLYQGKCEVTTIVEISEGGLSFNGKLELKTNETILISFHVSARKFICVRAGIAYSKKLPPDFEGGATRYYGVKFLNLKFESKKYIREYIAAKTEGESQVEFDSTRDEGPEAK